MKPEQGEQGELYRWVKASERLPEFNLPDTIWRFGDSHKAISHEDISRLIKSNSYHLINQFEWLCKLSSPPPQDERIKELENFLRTIRTGDLETIRKEASYLLIKK